MVADAVIYHPSVAHYLKFVATTVGRDKLLRTVQYFARFYAWYLLRTNAVASAVAPWTQTKKQLGLMRKFFRIGKNIEHLKAAATAADAKVADPFLRYTSVGRQLGYAGYLSFDAATVLDAAAIRKWEGAKRAQTNAYRCWAFGILFSIAGQLYTQYRLNQREANVDKKDGEGVVESKRIALYVYPPAFHLNPQFRMEEISISRFIDSIIPLTMYTVSAPPAGCNSSPIWPT